MKIRERLTYANVTSTLALVLVIGGGSAYAAGFIDSGDIVNNSIESRDLSNRDAVKARDVRRNGLTGREIKEKTLEAAEFAPASGAVGGVCDPNGPGFSACTNTPVRMRSRGSVLVVATGEFVTGGETGSLECRIFVDGDQTQTVVMPGSQGADEDAFALTHVASGLDSGQHQISLRCEEEEADGQLLSSSIAVLGISG